MFNDLMENIEWFFNLHDKNKDGYLTKDEVLTLSESFLVSNVFHVITVVLIFCLVYFPLRSWGCLPGCRQSFHDECI